MFWIALDDALLFLLGIVVNVVDGHGDDRAVARLPDGEPPHYLRGALERRECRPYRTLADVCSGQNLGIDVEVAFLIQPAPIQAFTLEAFPPRYVGLEPDSADAAGDVFDPDGIEQVGNTAG